MKIVAKHIQSVKTQHIADPLIVFLFQEGEKDLALSLFQQKYASNLPFIRAYLLNLGCAASTVDDVIQDAWLQCCLSISEGKVPCQDDECLFRWLFCIARNIFLKACRKRKQYRALFEDCDMQVPQMTNLADSSEDLPEPDEAFHQVFLQALGKESERNRQLLLGYYLDGRSYEELATELNYSSSKTAKQRCFMVRMAVRQETLRKMSA